MGYGLWLWVMGYGLWVMGYGLWYWLWVLVWVMVGLGGVGLLFVGEERHMAWHGMALHDIVCMAWHCMYGMALYVLHGKMAMESPHPSQHTLLLLHIHNYIHFFLGSKEMVKFIISYNFYSLYSFNKK